MLRLEVSIGVQAQTFPELLERLWVERHTGPVVVHFAHGKPLSADICAPAQRIALDTATRQPQT